MLLKPRTIQEMRKQIGQLDPPPKVLVIAGIHEPAEPTHRLITSKTGKKRFHEWYKPEDVVFVKYPASETPVKALLDAYKKLSNLGSGNRIGNAKFKGANAKNVSELREKIRGALEKLEEDMNPWAAALLVRKAMRDSHLSRYAHVLRFKITGLNWDLLWSLENRRNLGEHPSTTPIELHYSSYGAEPFITGVRDRNLFEKLVKLREPGEINALELPSQETNRPLEVWELEKNLPQPARSRANFMYSLLETPDYKYPNQGRIYLRVWPESMHETKAKNLKFLRTFLNKLVKNKAVEKARKQP